MAFGKRGTAAALDGGPRGGLGAASSGIGYGEEIRFDHGGSSVFVSLLFVLLGAGLVYYVPNNYVLDFKGWIAVAAGGLIFVGFTGKLLDALLGKAQLILDERGLRSESVFGDKAIGWEDLSGFEILSVNYTKTVFACAREKGPNTTVKKMAVPTGLFKDKSMRLVKTAMGRRPDLAPQVAGVMHKVGAKKLAGKLGEAV